MFKSRSGRPSLIGSAVRTAGKTAIVVGTANAVSGVQRNRVAARAAVAHAPPAAPDGGLSGESLDRLKLLAELHAAGILSNEEFAEQKSRILHG